MGKLTISMAMFHSYFDITSGYSLIQSEGIPALFPYNFPPAKLAWLVDNRKLQTSTTRLGDIMAGWWLSPTPLKNDGELGPVGMMIIPNWMDK